MAPKLEFFGLLLCFVWINHALRRKGHGNMSESEDNVISGEALDQLEPEMVEQASLEESEARQPCCRSACKSSSNCGDQSRFFCCPYHKMCMDRTTKSTAGPNCDQIKKNCRKPRTSSLDAAEVICESVGEALEQVRPEIGEAFSSDLGDSLDVVDAAVAVELEGVADADAVLVAMSRQVLNLVNTERKKVEPRR